MGGGGGCKGKVRRSVSSRETLMGACSGVDLGGGVATAGVPEGDGGPALADCSSRWTRAVKDATCARSASSSSCGLAMRVSYRISPRLAKTLFF